MIVIFQCFGGTHTSVVAASIYLGRLPRSRVPWVEELLALPYFDRAESSEVGSLNYVGLDREGNPVFVLGSGRWGAEIRELLSSFLKLSGSGAPPVAIIDCLTEATLPVRVGGFFSRRLGLAVIGRPLVARGILWSYPRLLKLVKRFEQDPNLYLLR